MQWLLVKHKFKACKLRAKFQTIFRAPTFFRLRSPSCAKRAPSRFWARSSALITRWCSDDATSNLKGQSEQNIKEPGQVTQEFQLNK